MHSAPFEGVIAPACQASRETAVVAPMPSSVTIHFDRLRDRGERRTAPSVLECLALWPPALGATALCLALLLERRRWEQQTASPLLECFAVWLVEPYMVEADHLQHLELVSVLVEL